jgi:pimeloyl-ACP methyl ester carboxylesterase
MNWIFLRGLTRETAHWGSFPAEFQQALPGSSVVCLDLPGNGQLHRMASPLSIAATVAYCRDELMKRGQPPPYCLLAMSLGAMVATEWSYAAPGEIAGCVLINTSLRVFSPFYRRLQPRNYLRLLSLVLLVNNPADAERLILRMTSNLAARQAQVIDECVQARLDHPVSTANGLRQIVAALRYRARSQSPGTKVLVLSSELDALVHAGCSLAIAENWKCPVRLHPFAGHDLALDDPKWLIKMVRAWAEREQIGR